MESEETNQVIDLADPSFQYEIASEDEETPTFFEFAGASFEDSDIENQSHFDESISDSDEPVKKKCKFKEENREEDKDRGNPPNSIFEDSDVEDEFDFGNDVIGTSSYDEPFLGQSDSFKVEENMENNDMENDTSSSTWRKGITPPNTLPFTGKIGLQVKMDNTTPFDYFRLLVTDKIVANRVTETNRYAAQSLKNKTFTSTSRFKRWQDVTIEEMWAFLGLIISMGLIVIDYMEDYWSLDPLYKLPFFSSVMRKDRFHLIMSFLHVCNPKDQGQKRYDPIFKIKSFLDSLIHNFKSVFHPGDKVSVDEGMVAWKGPLSFRVFDPAKQEKLGIKLFQLCDCSTGYCCNLEFYTGMQETSSLGAAFDIVNRLISPYLGCGRTLYVDSVYTSPDLFSYLRENGTMACGTMKKNVVNGPPKTMIPKLEKIEDTIITLTNGQLNFIQFMDRSEVRLLTTAHGADMIATEKKNPVTNETIMKLEAVCDYNQNRGAVDRSDTMVAFNTFKRRSLKWWKKTFFHLFNLAVLNAYIMHRSREVKVLPHRVFRKELAKQLVQKLVPITSVPPHSLQLGCGNSSVFRLTARHFPKLIPRKPGKKRKNPQRDCVVCTVPERRALSRFECPECDVGLHVDPCFRIYHTKNDYKSASERPREQKRQPEKSTGDQMQD